MTSFISTQSIYVFDAPIHPADAVGPSCQRDGGFDRQLRGYRAQSRSHVGKRRFTSSPDVHAADPHKHEPNRCYPPRRDSDNFKQLADLGTGSSQTLLLEGDGSNSNASTIEASGQNNIQGLISSLNSSLNGDYTFAGTNYGHPTNH